MTRLPWSMLFDLAAHLGFPHPDHLAKQLNARQITEWMQRLAVEPVGESRADVRQAVALRYLLQPYMDADQEEPLPDLIWPHEITKSQWDAEQTERGLAGLLQLYEHN